MGHVAAREPSPLPEPYLSSINNLKLVKLFDLKNPVYKFSPGELLEDRLTITLATTVRLLQQLDTLSLFRFPNPFPFLLLSLSPLLYLYLSYLLLVRKRRGKWDSVNRSLT